MARLLGGSGRTAQAEIDNVVEHAAGLRSLSKASRILRMEPTEVVALIDRGAFPDAYQVDGQWRIPLHDIRRVRLAAAAFSAHDAAATAAALVRWRWPYEGRPEPPAWLTPMERRELISQKLISQDAVRISVLSAELGVSQMTIRRDLNRLEAEGRLVRTYGGALAPGSRALALAPRQPL
jgi:hypothetical protein